MDLVLIELLLWGGLIFFFWALKDGLGSVESDIEKLGVLNGSKPEGLATRRARFIVAEQLVEPIGSYMGAQIHRYAIISGKRYRFDRVQPPGMAIALDADERYLEPGLVYQECVEMPDGLQATGSAG
ncbi:hypothetical protein [Noviherbaspirillum galbum]|uniref:Uncharacterized protein n=1 Tax=Noviherbaspirillum galbum TaxID=2709383 RepID=A0A6B3SM44_9BURK|nr:hypothetical protein [Noviherbaspirillum galbum]NEX59756.1 hypothetical protein [Noviherbaspirillum galbum]